MPDAREVAAAATEAFDAHDEERIRELYAEDATMEAPGDVRLEGRDAIVQYAMSWLNAFPDARTVTRNEFGSGEWWAQEFTFEGTHEGPLAGPQGEVPPTHRRLSGRGVEVIRVVDGKIVEDQLYFDQAQVMTQLGLMPEAAATA